MLQKIVNMINFVNMIIMIEELKYRDPPHPILLPREEGGAKRTERGFKFFFPGASGD
jgi:hypothetical protein